MIAVTETNLHFGHDSDDPNGVRDCPTCRGRLVVNGVICPACHARQQLRNAWWQSSTGPTEMERQLRRWLEPGGSE